MGGSSYFNGANGIIINWYIGRVCVVEAWSWSECRLGVAIRCVGYVGCILRRIQG